MSAANAGRQCRSSYDPHLTTSGELKRKTDTAAGETTEFVHDGFGNLSEVTLPDGRRVTYESDPTQRRVTREVVDAQGNTTDFRRYVYRDSRNPVATLDQNGELEARFVYGEKPWVPSYMVESRFQNTRAGL